MMKGGLETPVPVESHESHLEILSLVDTYFHIVTICKFTHIVLLHARTIFTLGSKIRY